MAHVTQTFSRRRRENWSFPLGDGWIVSNNDSIYRINFKRVVICDLRSDGGSVVYCLNFISRIAQRKHTCAYTRCCAAAHVLCTEYVYTCIRVYQTTRGNVLCKDTRSAECRGKPEGNTGSCAHKPFRRHWSFFPFMRFIRSCHFVCLHPRAVARRCACARADLVGSGIVVERRRNGTLRMTQTGRYLLNI